MLRLFFTFCLLLTAGLSAQAYSLNGVPSPIMSFLQSLDEQDDTLYLRYGRDGTITVQTPDKSTRYYPLIVNTDISGEQFGTRAQFYSDGSISFSRHTDAPDIIYAPVSFTPGHYPLLQIDQSIPAVWLPDNTVLPPGTITSQNIRHGAQSIPPLKTNQFLKQNNMTLIEEISTTDRVRFQNQFYKVYDNFIDQPGFAAHAGLSRISLLDNGSIFFPDGLALIPLHDTLDNQPQWLDDNFLIWTINSYPEAYLSNLSAYSLLSNKSIILAARTAQYDFSSDLPVFLAATRNTDGSFSLYDGTVVNPPPIYESGYQLDSYSGQPKDQEGMLLPISERGLLLDPLSLEEFIPGIQQGFQLMDLQLDPLSGYPLDPQNGNWIDPLTGIRYHGERGFKPQSLSPFVTPPGSPTQLCLHENTQEASHNCGQTLDENLQINDTLINVDLILLEKPLAPAFQTDLKQEDF